MLTPYLSCFGLEASEVSSPASRRRLCQRRNRFVSALLIEVLVNFALVAAFVSTSLANPIARGRVEGTIVDPAGAKVGGVRVALRDSAGLVEYQTRSNDEGHFALNDVAAGQYTLIVEAPGFSLSKSATVSIQPGVTANIDLRLEVSAISDRLIVTATRTASTASELGGSVSVITDIELKLGNQSLVTEPLRLIPGLAVVQTGGRGGLTSIFTRGGESDYNKVLIDGVAANEAGGFFDFGALTPENIDRVEVVRGPRSALFGSDAMTSVIQIVTRRGSTSIPEFEFSGEGGSFNYHRETAVLSGLARWFDYSASFGFQATDGRFRNSDYVNRSASANFGFCLSPNADLRITSRWLGDTLGVAGPTAVLFADPDERQKRRDLALSAKLDLTTTTRWHQTARFVYSEFNRHSFDPVAQDLTKPDTPPLPPFSFSPDSAFDLQEHQKRAGVHYQTIATITSSNVVTAGADFEHEAAVFTDDFSGRVSPVRNNLGLYVQDQGSWLERLFVTGGVRVERNTAKVPADLKAALAGLGSNAPGGEVGFGISANPSLAASFLARRHQQGAIGATRLKASFGTGIKEPEMHEAFSPNMFFLGNPSLNPERAVSFDAGAVQEFFNRRASLEATYFDNRFRDLIVFEFDPVTFGPIKLPDGRLTNFVNFDRASARGLELVGSARPVLHLRVTGSYTFLRSRLDRSVDPANREVGLPLLRRPRHSGSLEIIWTAQRYDLSLDGSFVGNRRDIDPVSGSRFDQRGQAILNSGYAKINLTGSYRISRFARIFARVENLMNQDYQEVLGFPAYRLNFSAGLRVMLGGSK
jgi:outer membrane cobalamin receptor